MEVWRAIILGVVQGVAEFIPISSSGHLRLIQDGLGWGEFELAFDVLLHLGTLVALVVYFRDDLWRMATSAFSRSPGRATDRRLAWLVVAATVPTGAIGLAGNAWFEAAPLVWVGVAFMFTGAALFAAERFSRRRVREAAGLSWSSALLVGVAQGVAIMPGVSRSGATMATGLGLGLNREQATRFSFLLSGPIILLAGAKKALELTAGGTTLPSVQASIAGFVAASLTGYVAIAALMSYIRTRSFYPFAAYTTLLGLAVVVWRVSAG